MTEHSKVVVSTGQPTRDPQSQLDKFKDAAHRLGTDDDPERFKERVRKLATARQLRTQVDPENEQTGE